MDETKTTTGTQSSQQTGTKEEEKDTSKKKKFKKKEKKSGKQSGSGAGGEDSGNGNNGTQTSTNSDIAASILDRASLFNTNYALKKAWLDLKDGVKFGDSASGAHSTAVVERIQENVNFSIVDFIPTVGYATDRNDPINVWSNEIMSALKAKLNKTIGGKYDANTIVAWTIAGDSINLWLNHLSTLVQLMNTYTIQNVAIPQKMIKALGYDYNDLRKNYLQLKDHIEATLMFLSSMYIPYQGVWTDRHQTLVSMLFSDSIVENTNPRGNYILFKPKGYWQYSPATKPSTTYDILKFVSPGNLEGTPLKFQDIVNFTNVLIGTWNGDEIIIDMNGDLQRVFTADNILVADRRDLDVGIGAIHAAGINIALHNANIYGDVEPAIKEYIPKPTSGSPYLKSTALYTIDPDVPYLTTQLLDVNFYPGTEPSLLDKALSLRWKYNLQKASSADEDTDVVYTKSQYMVKDFTTEIITSIRCYGSNLSDKATDLANSGAINSHIYVVRQDAATEAFSIPTMNLFIQKTVPTTTIDCAPLIYLFYEVLPGQYNMAIIGNQFNVTEIDYNTIHQMNYAMNMNMFPFDITSPVFTTKR